MQKCKYFLPVGIILLIILAAPFILLRIHSDTTLIESLPYPSAYASINKNGTFTHLNTAESGSFIRNQDTGKITEADFRILFPAESTWAIQTPTVDADPDGSTVKFTVYSPKPTSGIQVLRWPLSAFGSGNVLDIAERVAYESDGDTNTFTCYEKYLYSIYITWDDCFVEYVFRTE